MNKETKKLLNEINSKKNTIRQLVADGKTDEAAAEKVALVDMQRRLDILVDLEDEEIETVANGGGTVIEGDGSALKPAKPAKNDIARAFVNTIICRLRKRTPDERDAQIMNEMSEGSDEDGGFTVPQDIQTDIIELRRSSDDLETLVNVERVSTLTGSRVIEVDADSTPWKDVEEGAAFTEEETPKFKLIKYEIKKKGGILKVTRELLKDTAENILAYIKKWIARKSRATRNTAILKKLDEMTSGKEVKIEAFDDFKDIFGVRLDVAIAASSIVLTNQSGFNWLDKQKDSDGNYIMQPDVTDRTKNVLFGKYPVRVVSNKTLKNGGEPETNEKYPFYIGDLKEAITLFDRENITIETSTEAGDLWEKDKMGIKVRDRFDVQAVDGDAVVKGEVTINIAG